MTAMINTLVLYMNICEESAAAAAHTHRAVEILYNSSIANLFLSFIFYFCAAAGFAAGRMTTARKEETRRGGK